MLQLSKSIEEVITNQSGVMEAETISKNGHIFTKRVSILMIAALVAVCAVFVSCEELEEILKLLPPSIDVCIIMPTGNQSTEYWERNITVPEDIKEIEVVVTFNAPADIAEISIKKTGGANLSGYPKKGSFDSGTEHTAKWPVRREKAVGSNEVISYDVSVTDKNSDHRTTTATIKITFQ